MSTPERPDGHGPGPDQFAETMSRPLPRQDQFTSADFQQGGYPSGGYQSGGYQTGPYGYPQYAPPPPPQQGGPGRAIMIGLAIGCIIALVVAGVIIVVKLMGDDGAAPTQAGQQQTQQDDPSGAAGPTTTTVAADPGQQLAAQAATDAAEFRGSLNNTWTAQISSKRPGLFAEGQEWNDASILAEFNGFKSRYPQVKLLFSSEWPVFSEQGWWVSVSAQRFSSPSSAIAWCRSNGLDADHCFAKLVSTTHPVPGSTVYK